MIKSRFKKLIKPILHALGVDIVSRDSSYLLQFYRETREATPKFPKRLIQDICDKYNPCNVIQIGANDGDDWLLPFLEHPHVRAIRVEPQPTIFEKLQHLHADHEHVICEQAAISNNTPLTMYAYESGVFDDHVSSLDRNHLVRVGKALNINSAIRSFEVSGLSLRVLFEKHGVTDPHILVIDVEGVDHQVLKQIQFDMSKPVLIIFERDYIPRTELLAAVVLLSKNGYQMLSARQDIWAIDIEQYPDEWVSIGS